MFGEPAGEIGRAAGYKDPLLVAEIDGAVVGFCSWTDEGYIDLLYVHHKWPRLGIASALHKRAEDALRAAGTERRALVASFQHRVLRRIRRAAGGEYDTGASRPEIGVFWALSRLRLEALISPAYTALQVPTKYRGLRVVTPRFVRAAHSRGVRVDVWTINEPGEMRELLDMGVDSVMTDRPEVLAEVLEGRKAGRRRAFP